MVYFKNWKATTSGTETRHVLFGNGFENFQIHRNLTQFERKKMDKLDLVLMIFAVFGAFGNVINIKYRKANKITDHVAYGSLIASICYFIGAVCKIKDGTLCTVQG